MGRDSQETEFELESVELLLETSKSEYENEHNRTTVIDSDGKVWNTKEPAIMFFFKNRWFNIIGQLKD